MAAIISGCQKDTKESIQLRMVKVHHRKTEAREDCGKKQ